LFSKLNRYSDPEQKQPTNGRNNMTVKQHAASLVACLTVDTSLDQVEVQKAIEYIERALRHYEQCPMK
jgi:hypothetical protein